MKLKVNQQTVVRQPWIQSWDKDGGGEAAESRDGGAGWSSGEGEAPPSAPQAEKILGPKAFYLIFE